MARLTLLILINWTFLFHGVGGYELIGASLAILPYDDTVLVDYRASYWTENDAPVCLESTTGNGSIPCFTNDTTQLPMNCTDVGRYWTSSRGIATYEHETDQISKSMFNGKLTLNFTTREDTGRVNSPPFADMIPLVLLTSGCSHTIQIPVGDVDGDVVRCGWSDGMEPNHADISLDKVTCELTFSPHTAPGNYSIALQIMDFRKTDVHKPLSDIPLHFFVQIYDVGLNPEELEGSGETDYKDDSCSPLTMQVFVAQTPLKDDCYVATVYQELNLQIIVNDPTGVMIDTIKPVGMTKSKAMFDSSTNSATVNITWVPTDFDKNRIHVLCFYAYSSNTIDGFSSSETRCVRIIVTASDGTSNGLEGLSCERVYPVCYSPDIDPFRSFKNATSQWYSYDEAILYECNSGLKFKGSDSKQLTTKCLETGSFEPLYECIPIVCALPDVGGKNISFLDNLDPSYLYNETLKYKCKIGFKFSNTHETQLTTQCLESGSFEPLQHCVRIECVLPDEDFWNVHFSFDGSKQGFYYDDVVSYSCMVGYKFNDSGSATKSAKCMGDGNFKGVEKCYPVGCELPDGKSENITYLEDTSKVYSYDGRVRYKCAEGFRFSNDASENVLRCLDTGFFDSFKKCNSVECSLPDISELNIEWVEVNYQRTFGYQDKVLYHCKEDYWFPDKTRVNKTVSCLQSQKFEAPTGCIERPKCPANVDKRGTAWNETKAGIKANTSCPEGSEGTIFRQCQLSGEWRIPLYDCVRMEIQELDKKVEKITEDIANATVEDIKNVVESFTNITESKGSAQNESNKLTAGEVVKLSNALGKIAETLNSSNSDAVKDDAVKESFLKTCDNLIDSENEESWVSQRSEKGKGAEKVLEAVDTLAEAIGRNLDKNKTKDTIIQKNLALEVKKIDTKQIEEVKFPDEKSLETSESWIKETKSSISLKAKSLNENVTYVTTVVMYRNMTQILPSSIVSAGKDSNDTQEKEQNQDEPEQQTRINGPILSMSVLPKDFDELNPPIVITFQHFETSLVDPVCSFLSFEGETAGWSNEGCLLASSSEAETVCKCSHLTNFAVLMSPFKEVETESLALEVISILGISVSILCLALTLIIHIAFWKLLRNDRTVILMNLCIALVISSIAFLAGINATENKTTCAAVAAFLQYMYLVVFSIMLVEGIVIALTIVLVFKTKRSSQLLLIPAWIVPAVIVGISLVATKMEGYGNKNFCWLSIENGSIWSFVGPALLILVCNVVCLVLVFRAMFKTAAMETKKAAEKVRTSFRCLCVLLPLMGLSWLFGIFNVSEKTVFIQYIFTILNAFQGFFIFLFHCVLNKQVKKAFEVRLRRFSVTHPSIMTFTSTLSRSNSSKVSKSEKSEAASSVSHAEEKSTKAGTSMTEDVAMSEMKKEFKAPGEEDVVEKSKTFSPGQLWKKIASRKKQEYTLNTM